jgi:EmrB/QacA subfamily drug resistance transporter
VGVLLVATFMDLLDTTIVNVGLPAIRKDLQASDSQIEWIVSGYVLSFAVALITAGRMGDAFGRKRVFLAGVAGFTAASALASFAPNAEVLVVSRFVQGLFAAVMIPQVLSIIQVLFAPSERAGVLGFFGAVNGAAAVAGPLLGGLLITYDVGGLDWRSIFVINVPVGLALLVLGGRCIPESRSREPVRFDPSGVVLISTALFLVVFALIEGRPQDWAWWIWTMLTVGVVLLVAFGVLQRREERAGRSPLVPPSLFAQRSYAAGVLTVFAFFSAVASFFLVLTIYLQIGLHFSALDAGLTVLPFSLAGFVASGASVPLVDRLGKWLVLVGLLGLAGATAWVGQSVDAHGDRLSSAGLIGPMILGGAGLALAVVPLFDVALAGADVSAAGAASGVLGTFDQIGSALGIAVIGVVFFGAIGSDLSSGSVRHALLLGLCVPFISLLLAAGASLLLPSTAAIRAHEATMDSA